MSFDPRYGRVQPVIARAVLELLDQVTTWEPEGYVRGAEIRRKIAARIEEVSPGVNAAIGVIAKMTSNQFLEARKGKSRREGNFYRLTDKGREWWNEHKDEDDWGYGKEKLRYEINPWLALPDSKLWDALEQGKSVRITLPCSPEVWTDFMAMARAGYLEMVVRRARKRD